MSRATYLLMSEFRILNDWARSLRRMFPHSLGVFLVGSALHRKDWRDVDVRIMLDDEGFEILRDLMTVDDLNLSLSVWGQKVTGLPIDCQVQDQTMTNAEHPGFSSEGRPERNAIGLPDRSAA
jgi:hypothetical protein